MPDNKNRYWDPDLNHWVTVLPPGPEPHGRDITFPSKGGKYLSSLVGSMMRTELTVANLHKDIDSKNFNQFKRGSWEGDEKAKAGTKADETKRKK